MRESRIKSIRRFVVGPEAEATLNLERVHPLMGLAWKSKKAYEDFAWVFIIIMKGSKESPMPTLSDVRRFVVDRIRNAPRLQQKLVQSPWV